MTRHPTASASASSIVPLLPVLLLLQVTTAPLLFVSAQKFEPYELNGGLIAAVAARDFIVIASDTRFMGSSGYDIVSRQHITSRLWMAGDDDSSPLLSSIAKAKTSSSRQQQPTKVVLPKAPAMTFIGSAGCSTDCEALKRLIQADLRQAVYFGECSCATTTTTTTTHPPVDQVANLLSQVLFSRRGFPFYAFCIVAGLHVSGAGGGGRVFVYDAIGSYEEVAVATTGTGRDLLQPILDGKFRTLVAATRTLDDTPTSSSSASAVINKRRTTTVPTQVDCTEEEAMSILIDGYRSVSEREIGVGDNMVLCVVRRKKTKQQQQQSAEDDDDDGVECSVYSVPLKQH